MTEEYPSAVETLIQKCLGLVQSLIALGDSTQSIELIQALLQTDPRHPQLHKKKAFALISQNRFDEALRSFDASIFNSANVQKSQCLVYKADLLYSIDRYSQALKIYQLLLAHNPNREEILYRKGLCALACGNYKGASQIFEKILSINQNYSQCYITNSQCLFMQKKYRKALSCLKIVAEKSSFKNTDALYLKASCHYNLKQYDNCEKQLKNILQIDFSHMESKILLAILKHKIKGKEL